jgi:exosome complex RNA-binding protein Rrp42 (RNase PH superfamily)
LFSHREASITDQPCPYVHVLWDIRLVRHFLFERAVADLSIAKRVVLADPTSFEEPLLDTAISVVLDEQSEVVSFTQVGLGISQSQDVLLDCISAAKGRHSTLKILYES